MHKLAIHIVEDEAIISQDLEEIVVLLGHDVEGTSMDYDEAMSKLPTSNADLFLLDIMLGQKKTGVDIAQELNKKKIPFIFVSSSIEQTTIDRVKETSPYGFILKPFSKGDIFIALEMALSRMEADKFEATIFISIGSGKEQVKVKDILYAEADGNYTHIYLAERKFTLNSNLKTVHADLLVPPVFMRVHKSFLVNRKNVVKVSKNSLELVNGVKVPKSRDLKFD